MKYDEQYKMWVHDGQRGLTDRFLINEVKSAYRELYAFAEGKVVLDIGANIGATSVRLAQVAERVIAFEPEPQCFAIAKKNLAKFKNVEIHNVAVSDGNGVIQFFVNRRNNSGLHSMLKVRGRDCINVPTTSFMGLLKKYRPDAVKFDAEGAEQYVADELAALPKHVKHISIEYDMRPGVMERNGFDPLCSIQLFKRVAKQFKQLRAAVPDPVGDIHAARHNGFYVGERK